MKNIYAKYLTESSTSIEKYAKKDKNALYTVSVEKINDEDVEDGKLFKVEEITIKVDKEFREGFKKDSKPKIVGGRVEESIEGSLTYNATVELVNSNEKDVSTSIGEEIISKYDTKKYVNSFKFNDLFVKINPSTTFNIHDYRPFKK